MTGSSCPLIVFRENKLGSLEMAKRKFEVGPNMCILAVTAGAPDLEVGRIVSLRGKNVGVAQEY